MATVMNEIFGSCVEARGSRGTIAAINASVVPDISTVVLAPSNDSASAAANSSVGRTASLVPAAVIWSISALLIQSLSYQQQTLFDRQGVIMFPTKSQYFLPVGSHPHCSDQRSDCAWVALAVLSAFLFYCPRVFSNTL
ncbi:hypothetical protein GGF37_003793, partial [Kickxella alabastrina]